MSEQKLNKVCANFPQDFTPEEQAQARANIGAQAALTAGAGITITNNVISSTATGGRGGLWRNDAELYLHHRNNGEHYHVRGIVNNCINHVAVTGLDNVICSLLIEAPTLEADEEQNYYVQFDCSNSSGGCSVDVENASPKLIDFRDVSADSIYLKTVLSNTPSDAIEKEAIVKDASNLSRYLQIDSASYYGVSQYTKLAGPKVLTDLNYSTGVSTYQYVSFGGSPTYRLRVVGGLWEIEKF